MDIAITRSVVLAENAAQTVWRPDCARTQLRELTALSEIP